MNISSEKSILDEQRLQLAVLDSGSVSALWNAPRCPTACLVFAHGAGAGMEHSFMTEAAHGLAARGVASLRFQFPYMERGSKRPDLPALCHATIAAAVATAHAKAPGIPLFAGGRSFGGRMTSQAQALGMIDSVRGLIFFGFPLHPARRPGTERAEHLARVTVPMLFLQGTRDELAELRLLQPTLETLGSRATLRLIEDADHSFHVPARTGRKDQDVLQEMLGAAAEWMAAHG